MKPIESQRRARAFTLMEAMVALLFMAILMPVLMQAIRLNLETGAQARQRAEVTQWAQAQLNELQLTGDWQGTTSGDLGAFTPDRRGEDYRWSLDTQDWETQDLQLLTLTVTWGRGEKEQELTLTTAVYDGDRD